MNLRSLANIFVAIYLAVLIISVAFAFEDSGEPMHWATPVLIENVFRFGVLGALALVVGLLALDRWRIQHFTKEWDGLVRFLSDKVNADFMDPNLTGDYKNSFKKTEFIRYEMVARMCLAFLDDMYHQNYSENMKDWYSGSLGLFAGRHWQWYTDNRDSYSADFQKFLDEHVPLEKRI